MEIKVYTIKLDPPRWVRNLIVYVAMPVGALLGTAAVVRAVPRTPAKVEDKLVAADVKADLANLNAAVTALQHAGPAPEAVRTAGASLELISSNGSTPVISRQSSPWIQNVRRNSAGNYTVTFQSNFFSGAPDCVVSARAGGGCTADVVGFSQFGNVSVATGVAGAPADAGFEIVCVGPH